MRPASCDLVERYRPTVHMLADGHFPDGAPITRETMTARRNARRAEIDLPPLPVPDPAPSLRVEEALVAIRMLALPVLLTVLVVLLLLALIIDPALLTGLPL